MEVLRIMASNPFIAPLLRPYVSIARLIVETIGPSCEVVLHDLSAPQHSVVHVENGVVTGRKLGESFEHIVKELIKRKAPGEDIIANYAFEHEGRRVRSSTLLIRDANGELAGALCINLDVDWAVKAADAVKFLEVWAAGPQSSAQSADVKPALPSSCGVGEVEHSVAESEASHSGRPMPREVRLAALAFMLSRGVFLVKGAVERAAERLCVSKVTVYADLDEIRRRSQG